MRPIAAVLAGMRTVHAAWRIGLLIWLVTLAAALVVAAPVAAVLDTNLGHSLFASRMADNFDPQWVYEFLFESNEVQLATLPVLFALVALFYAMISAFLNAGVLAVFTRATAFWPGCARHCGMLLRLLVYALICYGLVFAAGRGLSQLGHSIWDRGMEERPFVIFGWISTGVVLLLLAGVNLVFDYAKIHGVANDAPTAWRVVLEAFRFVVQHPVRAIGTYALVSLCALLLWGAYRVVAMPFSHNALFWLAAVFVLQQALIAGRIAIRLLYFASQTEIYLTHEHCAKVGA